MDGSRFSWAFTSHGEMGITWILVRRNSLATSQASCRRPPLTGRTRCCRRCGGRRPVCYIGDSSPPPVSPSRTAFGCSGKTSALAAPPSVVPLPSHVTTVVACTVMSTLMSLSPLPVFGGHLGTARGPRLTRSSPRLVSSWLPPPPPLIGVHWPTGALCNHVEFAHGGYPVDPVPRTAPSQCRRQREHPETV